MSDTTTRYVDLHLHTNHSDGTDTPTRLIERAAELNLAAVAVTDHDAVSALDEAARAAEDRGIEFLTGTEISAHFDDTEVHVLGYGIQADHAALVEALKQLEEGRVVRADAIVHRLKELGLPIDRAKVAARAGLGTIGRMHIAQVIHALGCSRTIQGAFDKYIGKGKPAYVEKHTLPCEQAIDVIHQARGLAVIAHPGFATVRKVFKALLTLPFDGIEVYHSQHNPGQVTQFLSLAHEKNLLITGGSDCHGSAKTDPDIGTVQVPYTHYARLKQTLNDR